MPGCLLGAQLIPEGALRYFSGFMRMPKPCRKSCKLVPIFGVHNVELTGCVTDFFLGFRCSCSHAIGVCVDIGNI